GRLSRSVRPDQRHSFTALDHQRHVFQDSSFSVRAFCASESYYLASAGWTRGECELYDAVVTWRGNALRLQSRKHLLAAFGHRGAVAFFVPADVRLDPV